MQNQLYPLKVRCTFLEIHCTFQIINLISRSSKADQKTFSQNHHESTLYLFRNNHTFKINLKLRKITHYSHKGSGYKLHGTLAKTEIVYPKNVGAQIAMDFT